MLMKGREGFAQAAVLRGAAVTLCNKHESQKKFLQSWLMQD
jgi:hypothetical protein